MKAGIAALTLVFGLTIGLGNAFALSCSQRDARCRSPDPAHNKGATAAQCSAALNQCKRDCKAGNKVYVGPVSGTVFPVTSCN